ncbi:MAG TPA: MarR family transcriptional regulator [Candidatus Limnocylindrales bacterium]|jgi:DNA-binding MarR family transcriptional regulator
MDRDSIDSVLRSLRRVSLQGSLFGHTVALRFGLSESDIEALEVLIDSGAATAGKLSDLMGLTTGAVTRVIDRLEQAGYVRRVPDPADRRRVIVEIVPERVAAVEATMARVGDKSASEIGHYSEAELAIIDDFLNRMAAVRREEASALREAREPAAGGGSEHAAPIGGLDRARLLFKSGAHELLLRGATGLDDLYRAKFEGPVPQVRLRDGVVTIQYRGWSGRWTGSLYKGGWQWDWHERRADVSLNAAIPWDVEIVGGAGKLQGKLSSLDVRSFELTGGVDQLRLTLGRPAGAVPIRLTAGVNNVRIERPAGVPVRLDLRGGAGRIDLDDRRLNGTGDTVLETPGATKAADLYQVEIVGGAAKITVTEAG